MSLAPSTGLDKTLARLRLASRTYTVGYLAYGVTGPTISQAYLGCGRAIPPPVPPKFDDPQKGFLAWIVEGRADFQQSTA
jgi:hypothetical protein